MFRKKINLCMFLLGLLCCSLGVKAQTSSAEAQVIPVNFPMSTGYFTALSDNGLWATAVATDEENTTLVGYPYLVDATTGKLTQLWSGSSPLGFVANDVTDDGKMVVGSANGSPAYYDVDAGRWVTLPGDGEAICVTPDGSRIAGFAFGGSDGSEMALSTEHPRVWDRQADGSYRQVDVDSEFSGFPRKDKNGSLTNMRRISNMSADGKIFAGAINFVYLGQNCYYVYDSGTQQTYYVDNLLPDGFRAGSFIDTSNMSNDGAYMTGFSQIIDAASGSEYNSAYRMDITGGTLDLYNTFSDEQDRGGFAVSNAGTVFASSPAINPLRYVYMRHGNLWYGLDEIISGRYNIDIYERLNQECTGYAVDVSDDERVLLGMSTVTGSGYIIRLPETFSEATSAIDPLEAYAVYPEAGSSFARFREATIRFSKPTSLVSGAQAQLLDESGNNVRSLTISANSDGVSFVVGSRPATLEPGKRYTVYFPAGTFQLTADESFKNKEIRINYVGRENTPAQVTGMSPADGANVSEISTSQPVRIAFDMDIAVAEDADGNSAVAYLYEGDGETPVCELALTALDNQVGLAPALRRYLRLGTDYRVVLPANSVTDIMGDCGNEEITITYHGAFEPEPDGSGDLFFDDFNDPSVSIARYLLYEGDHNTPASVPASWEFDKDNTPWNFTIRSTEETSDYCAASHSMYSPSGKSDDWMSLPQQYIENGDFYLSFDAQSFQFSKNDSLKVYILEEDGGYVNFTQDLYNKFKTNGKLVFKEKLTPGKSQDELEGDWTNFEIPLSDYAGKYIYIAFVNDNENQSAIFLDNVRIYYRGDFVLGNTTATAVVGKASTPVTAQVNVTGDNTYNDLTATLTSDGFTSTYTAAGLGLTKDSPAYTIEFPDELPLTVGEENDYTITVSLDGTQLSRNGSVKNLAFETTKRVLVEEGTGQWCGNCPAGILALENLDKMFGDQVVSIGVHGGGADIFAYQTYCDALGFSAYPTGQVNRIDTLYVPTVKTYDPETLEERFSFNSLAGNETFLDIVQREFEQNPVADADVNILKADYVSAEKRIVVEGNVKYAVNLNNLNQNMLFVIVENGLEGSQANYFYSNSDPLFGRFGQGGEFGQNNPTITFDHVARRVIDDYFNGMAGMIPANVTANSPVEFTVDRTAPDNVVNWANAEIVAAVINNNTGRVVNVAKVPFTVDGVSGIGSVGAEAEGVSVVTVGGSIVVSAAGGVNVAVYDASGSLVGTKAGSGTVSVDTGNKGLYIVKATADGASVVRKVVVR